jgi:hypothetical protein
MRFSLGSLFLFFLYLCFAIADQIPSYILFYPYGTPEEIKAEAKAVIIQSGGKIMYEYSKYLQSRPPLFLLWRASSIHAQHLILR